MCEGSLGRRDALPHGVWLGGSPRRGNGGFGLAHDAPKHRQEIADLHQAAQRCRRGRVSSSTTSGAPRARSRWTTRSVERR